MEATIAAMTKIVAIIDVNKALLRRRSASAFSAAIKACCFLVSSDLAVEYARKYLASRQQDDFTWQGKEYVL